jgi:type II secretory pathway pseudopilin PulG
MKSVFAFTILELLIVIAIIIFLGKMMMPRYQALYTKTRQTEVALNLTSLYAAQQAFQLQHGRFANTFKELEWHPKGYNSNVSITQNAYTYGYLSATPGEGISYYTGSSQTPHTLLGSGTMNAQHFTIYAIITNGSTIERWQLNESGDISLMPNTSIQ